MAGAFRRWNARRRSPSIRALRDAGPPFRWILAAIPVALIAVIVLYLAGVENRAVLVATPLVAFILVGLLDRDGWRIRMAMAEVAVRQRERWRWGTLPIDPISAGTWLSMNVDAPPVARAAVLATAGRHEEARALVEASTADTPLDAVNIARLRILFAAEARGDHSIAGAVDGLAAVPEMANVPAEEGRNQRLAIAWSLAWLRIRAGEPWRDDFATVIRPLAPFRVRGRYQVFHAVQQYALPLAYVGALVIVWGLGLMDVLLR